MIIKLYNQIYNVHKQGRKNLTLILFKNKIFKIFILKIIEYYGIA